MQEIVIKSSAQLQEVITSLENYNKQFETKVQDLVKEQQKVNGMWTGPANDQFNENFNKDKAQFDEFHNVIKEYVDKLKRIKEQYEAGEEKNKTIAGRRR